MRHSWDQVWMETAFVVGKRSACVRRQIGCVVVDTNNRILSTGYNGPPPAFGSKSSCSSYCPRASEVTDLEGYTDCISLHAEANALSYTDPLRAIGGTAYVNGCPCYSCAKLLAGAQLSRVVYSGEPIKSSLYLFRSCKIAVTLLNVPPPSIIT